MTQDQAQDLEQKSAEADSSEKPEAEPKPRRQKRNKAENKSEAEETAGAPEAVEEAAPAKGKKKVKSLVNMSLHDGTQMVKGKHVELAHAEYERLKADPRGPHFEG